MIFRWTTILIFVWLTSFLLEMKARYKKVSSLFNSWLINFSDLYAYFCTSTFKIFNFTFVHFLWNIWEPSTWEPSTCQYLFFLLLVLVRLGSRESVYLYLFPCRSCFIFVFFSMFLEHFCMRSNMSNTECC